MARPTDQQVLNARRHYSSCLLCEHRCNVDRNAGERGDCKAGVEARVFRHRIEYGEELELIPSQLFYLSGCDLRCAFCVAEANAFDPKRGTPLTRELVRKAITWGRTQGVRTVQWVGGEPTIHLPAILDALHGCDELPPIVWKSDFHNTPEVFELLEGVVDTYVADFKFGNDDCAQRIARVPNYVPIVTRNLKLAAHQCDLIVRHLLMPGHFDCCFRPVVEWMSHNLPTTKFSLRDGYLPKWQATQHAELAAYVSSELADHARSFVTSAGLNLIQ